MGNGVNRKKILSCPLLIAAFLFLFNPIVAIVDPLPDFIGYILLCAAISRFSDVHERLGDAFFAFRKMIFIDGGKFLVMLWVFAMSAPNEKNSSIMLWAFVFAVLDFVFLIPAYNKLFDGLTQVGYLYENKSIFGASRYGSYTGRIRILTVIFVSVKAVLSFLPELADLTNTSYDETAAGTVNLYRFIGLLRVMAVIPVLILGIVWLCFIISYFRRVCADTDFQNALGDKYEKDIRPKVGLFVRRGFSTVMILAVVALCFTVDVRLEDVNILPDFLAAIFFGLTFIYIGRHNGQKKKKWIPATVTYFCMSLAAAICEYIFFEKYYYGAIIKSDEAKVFYVIFVIIDVIKSGAFLWVLLKLYGAFGKMITQHTGFVLGRSYESDAEGKLVEGVHNDLKSGLKRALGFAAVYIASDICYDIFAPKVKFMGFINIIAAAICVGFFVKAFLEIQDAINTKYMLE